MQSLKRSGQDLLKNYFKLGKIVDTLHNEGFSYGNNIERVLRKRVLNDSILRFTALFSGHKFYLAVKNHFLRREFSE